MRRIVPTVGCALILVLSGCIGQPRADDPVEPSLLPPILDLPLFEGERLKVDVRVPVVLLGFPEDVAKELAGRLDAEAVDHNVGEFVQTLPPDPGEPQALLPLQFRTFDLPMFPTAVFDVRIADAQLAADVAALLPQLHLGDEIVAVYNGNAFEDFLAERLPAAGIPVDPTNPPLVLVHLDGFGVGLHGWRYDYPHGYLSTVQTFGERQPLLVVDPSASKLRPPNALQSTLQGVTGNKPNPAASRTEATDVDRLERIVREAMHFRILQSTIYPTALSDCHAITLIYAWRPTNVSPLLGLRHGDDLLNADELKLAYEHLTGGTVHVDVKKLLLPVDDPVLDALARGEFGTLELQRYWLSQNWDKYWVPHEGCEPYVSFVLHGDVASTPSGIIGIGTYDSVKSYRISISWVNEALRLAFDPASPTNLFGHASGAYNWVQFLFAHEVGHTIGMHHTFHTGKKAGGIQNNYFEEVWSAMGYRQDGRVIDFGAVDANNFQRSRAGFLFLAGHHLGLAGSEAWTNALEQAASYDWRSAAQTLWAAVAPAAEATDEGGSALPWLPGDLVVFPRPHAEGAHAWR
ncbi:MAG TPA: hypothetical protein VM681_04305 [Candidatus Thermoplasmatota archaeon]|nr:hypothetical protein [Candidatus Thermoplasmatota archaeon]